MTREEELLARWHAEQCVYREWGNSVSARIKNALASRMAPTQIDTFLKTSVVPRLKDDLKLVEKAFYRNKRYPDPYSDITDKVGTRFVVLLGREIRQVVAALEGIEDWTYTKDRDHEEEQKKNPIVFDYAAVHFVVRPKETVTLNGIQIPAHTPCEVQIKTLLQHAYSELTHDTIYKPQIDATPTMRRNAAKAMALLEATNDYFEHVQDEVDHALSRVREMTAALSLIYRQRIGIDPKPSPLEGFLLEAYEEISEKSIVDINLLLDDKPYLIDAIRRRVRESNPVFSQPSVLLVYLDLIRSPRMARQRWPLTAEELQPLLTDLGEGEE